LFSFVASSNVYSFHVDKEYIKKHNFSYKLKLSNIYIYI